MFELDYWRQCRGGYRIPRSVVAVMAKLELPMVLSHSVSCRWLKLNAKAIRYSVCSDNGLLCCVWSNLLKLYITAKAVGYCGGANNREWPQSIMGPQ